MTLGDVKTGLAQGIFDPAQDRVTLQDGTQIRNYYKDVLGTKYFTPIDKSHFPLPPSGWCTWYYYYSQINADEAKLNAKWIADNLKDYGSKYVQIDDGWQGANRANGGRDWSTHNIKFPDGMGGLATYIKSLGLTPGLWLAPHGQSNLDVVNAHPNVFLRKADGSLDDDTRRWEGRYLLDPSTKETQTYLTDLFTTLSKDGFEYFKIDGQPDVADEYRNKKSRLKNRADDTDELYRNTLRSIKAAIGPDRYLLGCWGTPVEGIGIYNGSRTGGDIVLGWGGFHVALQATLRYYFLHNIAWYGDPDVMLVRSPMTLDQARVWASLEGLTGQALMGTDRMVDLSPERVEVVRSVYPATDIRPLDLFPVERNKRIWDLKVNGLGRRYDVVGVFNFGENKPEQTHLKWADLGLPADKPVHVFDFWNKEYLGDWAAGIAVDAAPTSCRVLSLVPDDGTIQLVSTSRHITQGWVDLAAYSHNESGNTQRGISHVIKRDPYELRFAFPKGLNDQVKHVTATSRNGNLPVEVFNHQGWATVRITDSRTEDVKWEVSFESAPFYHFPTGIPYGLSAKAVGLDGVELKWAEQYYLNAGYQVYIDGLLQGYTPKASFTLRGLDPSKTYEAEVRTVWEDGKESPSDARRGTRLKFNIAGLVPSSLSLSDLEPVLSTANWRGEELDDFVGGHVVSVGGITYGNGLAAITGSVIEYDLKDLFQTFHAQVGLDTDASDRARVVFSLEGDGKEIWRSDPMTKSDGVRAVSAGLAGVHRLTLRVARAAGEHGGRDQADWIEPHITR